MRTTFFAIALAAALPAAASEPVWGFNLLSFHSKSGYETVTPGIYVRNGEPLFGEVGVYRNSQGFTSYHAGVGYIARISPRFDLGVSAGVVTGYRQWYQWTYPDGTSVTTYDPPKAKPFVLPSVGYHVNDKLAVRMFVIPPVEKMESWVASFSLEWKTK